MTEEELRKKRWVKRQRRQRIIAERLRIDGEKSLPASPSFIPTALDRSWEQAHIQMRKISLWDRWDRIKKWLHL